jgi:DNA/RNA endonuclease YhcR with UshA esterase domain
MRKLILCLLPSCFFLVDNKGSQCGNRVIESGELCYNAEKIVADSFAVNVLKVGDLDNDNDIDIVTLSFGFDLGFVSVFLNDGIGNFDLTATLQTPQTPSPDFQSLLLVDLNNDGTPEIVTANGGNEDILVIGNTISIFTNNGNGSFLPESRDISVGENPSILTASDINQDQFLDLLVISPGIDEISILLNDQTGQVTNGAGLFAEGFSTSMIATDMDNDDDPDLVVGDGDGFARVFLNDGTGQFQPVDNLIATEINSFLIAIDNFDNDEIFDLAFVNNFARAVSLVKGLGGNQFSEIPSVFTVKGGTIFARSTDINQDGVLDLVTAGNSFDVAGLLASISILLGDGLGGFQTANEALTKGTTFAFDIGDINSDSIPDFIFADESNFDAVKAFLSNP